MVGVGTSAHPVCACVCVYVCVCVHACVGWNCVVNPYISQAAATTGCMRVYVCVCVLWLERVCPGCYELGQTFKAAPALLARGDM